MKEFVLVFRTSNNSDFTPSPEQMQEGLTNWMNWMGGIAAQNKLVNRCNRLSVLNSKTIKLNNVVVDGPYIEIKEFINGYTVVKLPILMKLLKWQVVVQFCNLAVILKLELSWRMVTTVK